MEGSRFTFDYSVKSPLTADSLTNLLASDSATLKLRGSARSVVILPNGNIETIFRAFGYKAVTVTDKVREHSRIVVTVESFTHNWRSIPKVKSGVGVYRVERDGEGSRVIYSQEVLLDREISWFTEKLIRWQLNPLARDLENLVKK